MTYTDHSAATWANHRSIYSQKLTAIRAATSFTQQQLAERLRVSVHALSRWENGIVAPQNMARASIDRLWVELGIPPDKALHPVPPPTKHTSLHQEIELLVAMLRTEMRRMGITSLTITTYESNRDGHSGLADQATGNLAPQPAPDRGGDG